MCWIYIYELEVLIRGKPLQFWQRRFDKHMTFNVFVFEPLVHIMGFPGRLRSGINVVSKEKMADSKFDLLLNQNRKSCR